MLTAAYFSHGLPHAAHLLASAQSGGHRSSHGLDMGCVPQREQADVAVKKRLPDVLPERSRDSNAQTTCALRTGWLRRLGHLKT